MISTDSFNVSTRSESKSVCFFVSKYHETTYRLFNSPIQSTTLNQQLTPRPHKLKYLNFCPTEHQRTIKMVGKLLYKNENSNCWTYVRTYEWLFMFIIICYTSNANQNQTLN